MPGATRQPASPPPTPGRTSPACTTPPDRSGARQEPQDAFVWPPRAWVDEPLAIDAPTQEDRMLADRGSIGTRQGLGGALVRLERDLLGVRSLSFAAWARATGWTPEPVRASCWRCAGSVGAFETDGEGCAACRERRLAWSRALRLGRFEGGLRAAVLELKFGRWRRTGRELGRLLGERIRDQLGQIGVRPGEACLVPVPTTARRRLERGIDHTLVLARGASEASGLPIWRSLRRRHGQPQVGLTATARALNVRGAFRAVAGHRTGLGSFRVIVVVDDVRTTGATLTAACRALRSGCGHTPLLWCSTVCVASDRREISARPGVWGP